jgi:transcriptional regulator with XRE-family HTH domain
MVSEATGKRARLAQRRRMAGFTQDSLAEYVDVALSSVKRWEGGHTTPQPALRRRLANALDIGLDELDELLSLTDEPIGDVVTVSMDAGGDPSGWLATSDHDGAGDDQRSLLAHVAQLASAEAPPSQPATDDRTSLLQPCLVTEDTIDEMRRVTAELRAIDVRYGGGACRSAASAHLAWGLPLLDKAPAALLQPLSAAVAEVHALIGWTAMDVGARSDAQRHLVAALELARHSGDKALVAEVLYRMARHFLHQGHAEDALELLRLGHRTVDQSVSPLAVTVLWGNIAWCHAELGDGVAMQRALDHAEDSFARTDLDTERWFKFFTPADFDAMRGVALATLAAGQRDQADNALSALQCSVAERDDGKARSLAFELIAMATAHLYAGDIELGIVTGHEAVDLALRLRSIRVVDRLAPLLHAAAERRQFDGATELMARIDSLRA